MHICIQVVAKATHKNVQSRLEHFKRKWLLAKADIAKAKVAKTNVVKAKVANTKVAKAKAWRIVG